MSTSDDRQVKQWIAELRSFDKDKRRTAVMQLGMHGGEEAFTALTWIVQNAHEDIIVRARAAQIISRFGDMRAVPMLIEALTGPGFQAQINAAESLGKLGDSRAIPHLLRALCSESDKMRNAAHAALVKLGHQFEEDPKEPQYA